ncbi:MAG: hypothetical protein A4E31_00229 [Methanomassiliicoccales archaeon PtaU1.Bin030]|nr:MAG: hypothetical protein A4E31_00229 [Methanomassiliicoccales archaeon PtaU1.Bin030]
MAVDKKMQAMAASLEVKLTNLTLRHTYGRMLWLAGVTSDTIMGILGHSDFIMTLLHRTSLRSGGVRRQRCRQNLAGTGRRVEARVRHRPKRRSPPASIL